MATPIRKVLIANRGEIACRIAATCSRLGIETVAVYSEADRDALHVKSCDMAVEIGPSAATQSYLVVEKLIDAARRTAADAIHPGYGFLSESTALAEACGQAGIVFVGPTVDAIAAMGSKLIARRLAQEQRIPCVPGYDGGQQGDEALVNAARGIGFPIIIKASAGGGGKGIRVVPSQDEFVAALHIVRREAAAAFGDDAVVLERYVPQGRHIEVQIVGDAHGNVIHLHDRECSLQRRHQKVVEEAPAPNLPEPVRASMREAAVRLARAIGYRSVGTVEFLYDVDRENFFFLEMNTRIQVEHPVTEMVTGLDLVALQLRIASGEALPLGQDDVSVRGHAMEARVNAEQPRRGFSPSIGRIKRLAAPRTRSGAVRLRFDTGVAAGSEITPYYDSMIAKIIAWGEDRETARHGLIEALDDLELEGISSNSDYLGAVLSATECRDSTATTDFLERFQAWDNVPEDGDRMLLAVAAAEMLDREEEVRAAGGDDPWAGLGGWRLLAEAGNPAHVFMTYQGEDRGAEEFAVSGRAGRYRARLRDREIEFTAERAGDKLLVRRDGVAFASRVVRNGDLVSVRCGSDRGTFRAVGAGELARLTERGNSTTQDVVAPIPGLVVEILVQPGDGVEPGQPVIVLEAMKMMHNLVAPGKGVVSELPCRQGEAVSMGQLLVRFSKDEAWP